MFVERYMAWSVGASAEERAEAIVELARHYIDDQIDPDEVSSTELVFTLYLDDPSPMVRHAMAEMLAPSQSTPKTLVWGLTQDLPDIAAEVYEHSPHFRSLDLLHAVEAGSAPVQCAVASREDIDPATVRAVALGGDVAAVCTLLENTTVVLGPSLKHDIATRLGDDPDVRTLLLDHDDLKPATRQMLLRRLTGALMSLSDDREWGDSAQMAHAANDACNRVTLDIAAQAADENMAEYVQHLRDTHQLTPALLVRAICSGNIPLFEAAISELSGASVKRVRSIVAHGRISAFRSLYKRTGLPGTAYGAFASAISVWQTAQEGDNVLAMIIARTEEHPEIDGALLALLGRMSAEVSRKEAVGYERQLLLEAA